MKKEGKILSFIVCDVVAARCKDVNPAPFLQFRNNVIPRIFESCWSVRANQSATKKRKKKKKKKSDCQLQQLPCTGCIKKVNE